ncbi:sensor histidine kinase [Cryobacterium sp. PH31-AA6]|uniref:sensor histidine kinase n=1 Tax=Cryobacterium sp. PH31-AA6 TaxID=3046205 RepID=UPI0024B89191|nr:sensor histidine kinase [Cryobacterium sp. PH31-AA6]MDJ0322954.1 sensor histidine kinase [Cryobacterium sp. PH31-AA6]
MTGPQGSALNPVFLGLRIGLHALVLGLVGLVVAAAVSAGFPAALVVTAVAVVFLGSYGFGALFARSLRARAGRSSALSGGSVAWPVTAWLAVLTAEWLVLAALSAEAIYLVFPLFFLYLHLLSGWQGPAAVVATTILAILAFGYQRGFSAAGVVGPLIGAAVAVAIGLAYRSLAREAKEREVLIAELLTARTRLAAAERAAGVKDERGRLAREIHDTVSQSLSSIVLLLHAAERSGPGSDASAERMRQARAAAADALAETRQFIDELAPPMLRQATLLEALKRLAAETGSTTGIRIDVTVAGEFEALPTRYETALLRIAQGALANAVQHAGASRIDLTLSTLDTEVILDVVDNGVGFDTTAIPAAPGRTSAGAGEGAGRAGRTSFGLRAMRERVEELGGSLTVESTPGVGTSVVAGFEVNG